MTGRKFQETRRKIRKLLDKWRPRMSLHGWSIDNGYHDDPIEESSSAGYEMAAKTSCQWQYKTATIRWYVPGLAKMSPERLEETVVHELCHVVTDEMQEPGHATYAKHAERVVTDLARGFLRTEKEVEEGK